MSLSHQSMLAYEADELDEPFGDDVGSLAHTLSI